MLITVPAMTSHLRVNRVAAGLVLGALSLIASGLMALPVSCPDPKEIQRLESTYEWQAVADPDGWAGAFVYPLNGRGHSTKVTHFTEARWIQLNSLAEAPGYVECDYQGNYPKEIVRLSLKEAGAMLAPKTENWRHSLNEEFPSVAAHCTAGAALCSFQ